MNLHLFSTPGQDYLRDILAASRTYLEGKPEASLAYLPLATLSPEKWLEFTEKSFGGLARIEPINTESMDEPEMEAILRRARLVFIPGGNTFLLNHRLHTSRLMPFLRKKVQAGLPLVACSAGTVLCGPDVLTSRDLNMVPTTHFTGLNVSPFNFSVHYPEDEQGRADRDAWLSEYHVFHQHPVIILADGACVRVEKNKTSLESGEAWILRPGQEKKKLDPGVAIPVNENA